MGNDADATGILRAVRAAVPCAHTVPVWGGGSFLAPPGDGGRRPPFSSSVRMRKDVHTMTRRPPPRSQRARRTARRSEEPAARSDRRERFDRARTARMIVKVKRERLALELQRGRLVARDRVERQAFAFGRGFREAWLTWPARIGAELAATLGIDATVLTVALETYVHRHLEDLAHTRFDLGE